jgi:hypothetical protein
MGPIRRHLTYANVVSTLCLVLLLGGGTALARAIITKNRQVARDTISGHHPPSGDHPNIIRGSIARPDLAAKLKESLRVRCPLDMDQEAGLCFETSVRDPVSFKSAVTTCARAQRRLPTIPELALVFEHSAAVQPSQWVAIRWFSGTQQSVATLMSQSASRNMDFSALDAGSTEPYRCVTSPTN